MTIRFTLAAVTLAVLAGCASAPQQPVALRSEAVTSQAGRIGVAMTAVPKADTHLLGAGCLLCMATAAVANNSLTTHAKTLPADDLGRLKQEVAALIRKKGGEVVVIDDALQLDSLASFSGGSGSNGAGGFARQDFRPLQAKYKVDHLLVMDLSTVGFVRNYSGYIPTSDPKGTVAGVGYLVNLKDNSYEWYLPVNVSKSAEGAWDEPPKFPGLTNAYFQAVELSRDAFMQPFGK